ncbi:unknown [Firmicutes bacterium CAG:137]|nr:unknown [Firmicutes bacterium CAG:137]
MKKKNKQKFASEEEPRQPQGPAQDSNFSLEEILREFGGGENAPAQNPPEAIPQSVQLDPAL